MVIKGIYIREVLTPSDVLTKQRDRFSLKEIGILVADAIV